MERYAYDINEHQRIGPCPACHSSYTPSCRYCDGRKRAIIHYDRASVAGISSARRILRFVWAVLITSYGFVSLMLAVRINEPDHPWHSSAAAPLLGLSGILCICLGVYLTFRAIFGSMMLRSSGTYYIISIQPIDDADQPSDHPRRWRTKSAHELGGSDESPAIL